MSDTWYTNWIFVSAFPCQHTLTFFFSLQFFLSKYWHRYSLLGIYAENTHSYVNLKAFYLVVYTARYSIEDPSTLFPRYESNEKYWQVKAIILTESNNLHFEIEEYCKNVISFHAELILYHLSFEPISFFYES